MRYVHIDPATGIVSWDRYFEYLREAKSKIPDALYGYVADWEHYSLNNPDSLHDAWLSSVQLAAEVAEVRLEFLGASRERRHAFRYAGVASYRFDLNVRYTYGDRDVLAHEFRFDEEGLITHEILFRNDRSIIVTSAAVVPDIQVIG